MADAAAHATITLAQSTEAVNGVKGKGNAGGPLKRVAGTSGEEADAR
jgi:hypothetical protein